MAKTVDLCSGVAATAGDQTAVLVGNTTPFLPGRDVVAHFESSGSGTAPAYAIDGSDDNSTWVADIATTAEVGHSSVSVKCYKYMRASITTAAGTPGVLSVWLEGV